MLMLSWRGWPVAIQPESWPDRMLTQYGQFSSHSPSQGLNQLLLLAGIVVISLAVAALVSNLPYLISAAIVVGIAVFITCFISTEFGRRGDPRSDSVE